MKNTQLHFTQPYPVDHRGLSKTVPNPGSSTIEEDLCILTGKGAPVGLTSRPQPLDSVNLGPGASGPGAPTSLEQDLDCCARCRGPVLPSQLICGDCYRETLLASRKELW